MNDENPSIGIILCRSKNRTVVEYTLRDTRKPIAVSTYRVVSEVPLELQGELPAPEQVAIFTGWTGFNRWRKAT